MAKKNDTTFFENKLLDFVTAKDPLLEMLQWMMDKFMEIEVARKTGAPKGSHSQGRTGPYADELARSLHTLALVLGTDIFFRNGAYRPETEEGRGRADKSELENILVTLQKEIDDDSSRKQPPFEGGEQCQPLSRDEMIGKIEGAAIRIYSHLRNLQEEHRNDVSKATDEILRLTKHTERVAEALEWMRHSKELENMDDDGLTALLVLCLENLHLLRKGRVSKKCTHSYDGAIDVAKYIVEEIKKNIKSTEALEIHDYMHYEKYLEKNYNFNGFAPPPDPLIIKAIGLAKWIEMVDTGHPWDHKPKISSLFRYCSVERFTRKGNLSKSHFHKYKNFDYFYDIWSNIHYGYVGRFCGISEQFLLLGSNLQQLYANLTSWKFFSGDDSADIISMKLGMRLYDEFKDNENGLTYTVVLERLEGLTSVGESRLLHTCLDKSWEGITFV